MRLLLLQVVLFSAAVLAVAAGDGKQGDWPEGVPKCEGGNKDLSECLKKMFQALMPKLDNGYKPWNIPAIEPFLIENSNYRYSYGNAQGRLAMKNTKVHGMSKTQIKDVKFKMVEDGTRLTLDFGIPSLFMEGSYKAEIKINDGKITPKGKFNVTMKNVKVNIKMEGAFKMQDGKRYLELVKFDLQPEIDDLKIQATGIFADPTLNSAAVDFVNDSWKDLWKVMLPETRQYWEPVIFQSINGALLSQPFDDFFTKN